MDVIYKKRHNVHPEDFKKYDTQRIRDEFLIEDVMVDDKISLTYSFIDRHIVGGAVPATKALELEAIDIVKSEYFLERRELGVINVGGPGKIITDTETYDVNFKEAVYLGRGTKKVVFESVDKSKPAHFYINSSPAHKEYPSKHITKNDARVLNMGSTEACNERTINQMIVKEVVTTCQLQMGITEIKPGSVWNTMPAHTHDRRMEAYFYFQVPEDQAICHFMGDPKETRHIWMKNEDAVLSPAWSIHSAAGTSGYTFIWGMSGENLDYTDMDIRQPNELR